MLRKNYCKPNHNSTIRIIIEKKNPSHAEIIANQAIIPWYAETKTTTEATLKS